MNSRFPAFAALIAATLLVSHFPILCAGEATNAPPTLPDLETPGVKTLIESYRTTLDQIAKDRKSDLSALLNRHLDLANEMLDEKKKVRNISGIAAATTGITIFQTALTNLAAYERFDLPEKARRELETSVTQCKTEASTVESRTADKKKALMASTLEKFTTLAVTVNPAIDTNAKNALESRLNELLKAGVSAQPLSGTPSADATGSGTNQPSGSATNLPAIFAASGEADQWATVATWHGTMMGMDVVSIPVAEAQIGTNVTRQLNPISGRESILTYVTTSRLIPADNMLFRLKRVRGNREVELMEWPTRGNGFQLVVRTRNTGLIPSHHAFDLQVSIPGGDLSKALTGATIETTRITTSAAPLATNPVTLTLITVPEGAAVYLDNTLQPKVNTSCRLPIPQGDHTLTFILPGYAPLLVTNQSFTADRTLRLNFLPDPRIQRKTMSILANSPSWTDSDVSVNKGDTLILRAEGQWACGPGRELCNASGYPNSAAFYRYYMDSAAFPRHTSSAGYGALVMRIGNTGRAIPVGKDFLSATELRFAATESGPVSFDINESDEAKYRTDNSGTLILHLTVIPPPSRP
jgi:hypothetical protein